MFPERRLLHNKHNALNRIAIKETFVIILVKVVWFGPMKVTHIDKFPRVETHCIEHFVPPFESCVGPSEVADNCHCRVPEMLIDNSTAQVVLDAPVH
jgi:hypothetical protein